eukprot:scaffold7814_cov70-Phaeocystis_antarctica.AAC.3
MKCLRMSSAHLQSGGGFFVGAGGVARLVGCNTFENEATNGGGFSIYGDASLTNCTVQSNIAFHVYDGVICHAAQGDSSTAALDAVSGKLRLDYGTRFANNWFRVGTAEVIYVLPAPPGHYTNARKCKVVYAPCPGGDPCKSKCNQDKSLYPAATTNRSSCTQPPYNIQPCPWSINLTANAFGEEILGLTLEKLLPGTYDQPEWPVPCSPGLLGATADTTNGRGQLTALCAGLCPAGYYCPDYATTVAISCTQGHFCPPGTSAPLPCEEGSYSTRTNLSSAAQCDGAEPGFYAITGSPAPRPCSPGAVAADARMGLCAPCAEGTFQDREQQTECKPCKQGSFCPEGASAPLSCAEGSYSISTNLTSGSECTETDAGHFAPTGSKLQIKCSPGTVAPNASMASCDKCEAGTYQTKKGEQTCVACEPGSYCPEGASAALPCKEGSYSTTTNLTSDSECTPTGVGHFAPTGSTLQTKCSPGTVAPNASMATCDKCEAGKYQADEGGQACIACQPGSYCPEGASAALSCEKGSYSNATNLTSDSECTETGMGHFAPTGSTLQTKCSPGTVAPNANMAKCDKCEAGTYQAKEGEQTCVACKPGHFCPLGASAPLPCEEGSYSTRTDLISATQCDATEPGFYATTGSTAPKPCSSGTVQPNASMATCVKCDEGKYQAGEGQQICETCGAGNYSSNVLSCEPCPVGEYCPDGLERKYCPTGSTTEGNGSASYNDCGCPKGTLDTAAGDNITCTPCNNDHMLCARTGLTLATVPLPLSRWRLSVTESHIRTWNPLIGADLVLASRAPSEPHR